LRLDRTCVILRTCVFFALISELAACGSSTEPALASTTIVGEFGGPGALLHADASHAVLDLNCASVTISAALMTDAAGQISTVGSRRRIGGVFIQGEGSTPVRITGRAFSTDGGTLQLVVSAIPEEPGASTTASDTLQLVRDRTTTLLLCP
jgi:hypothetical protein